MVHGSAYGVLQWNQTDDSAITPGPATDTSFLVLKAADGRPVVGARVEPWHFKPWHFKTKAAYEIVPEEARQLIGDMTDAHGRARLPGMRREGFLTVRVTAKGFGVQSLELRENQPAQRTIHLQPAGRVEGRLTAERPEWVRGVTILLDGKHPLEAPVDPAPGPRTKGHALVFSDAQGKFVVPEIAMDFVRVHTIVDQALPVRPRLRKNIRVSAGETTTVNIPLEPAVHVRGVIRVKGTGEPLGNARIHIGYGRPAEGDMVVSNEDGKFETYVLAGEAYQQVIAMPGDFIQLDGGFSDRFNVPAVADHFDLPPIEVVRAHSIQGRVIDKNNRPVADLKISGETAKRAYGFATSDKDGRFTMTRVPPKAELEFIGFSKKIGGERMFALSSLGDGRMFELLIVQADPLVLRVGDPRDPRGEPPPPSPPRIDVAFLFDYEPTITVPDRVHRKDLTDHISLGLSGKRITDAELAPLKRLTRLSSLSISHTSITPAGLVHLKEIENLTDLGLHGPAITDEWLEGIKELTKLERLSLRYTQITDAGLMHLRSLANLKHLDITHAGVGDVGLEHLQGLTNLEMLTLRDILVRDAGLESLKGFTKLESLYLTLPHVRGKGLVHLLELENLRELQFTGHAATNEWLRHVEPLRNVQWLDLNGTNVTGAGLSYITNWAKLRQLYLNRNPIGDDGLVHLEKLPLLDTVEMRRTRVTTKGVEKLRQILSDTGISH